jgi:uncharacterized RDD family membrane protein YckC
VVTGYRALVHVDTHITIETPEGVDLQLVIAGLGSRFLGRFVDFLIQAVIITLLLLATGGSIAAAGSDGGGWFAAFAIVIVFLSLFAYDIPFEVWGHGRTPGKRVAGTRVVGLRGEPIDLVSSIIRNVVRLIDFLPGLYLIGTVSVLSTAQCQRLGDLAAGTLVVRDRFGGVSGRGSIVPEAPLSVPPDDVMSWDVTAVDAAELHAVRSFLARRLALPWHVRAHLGTELAQRLAPKVVGVPPRAHPEYVLEGIVVAKERFGP